MNKVYCFVIAFLILSCNRKPPETKNTNKVAEFENIVGVGYLKLTADYDECGEWGGHHEEIKIVRAEKKLFAKITKDSVDCKNLTSRKIIEKKRVALNENHKKAISDYLHELLNKSLEEQIPYHAGQWYSAETIDSTLVLNYHEAKNNWKGFMKLKVELSK